MKYLTQQVMTKGWVKLPGCALAFESKLSDLHDTLAVDIMDSKLKGMIAYLLYCDWICSIAI